MAWLTTPPSLSLCSNMVTLIPALDKNAAAESPAGPPPIIATLFSDFKGLFSIEASISS